MKPQGRGYADGHIACLQVLLAFNPYRLGYMSCVVMIRRALSPKGNLGTLALLLRRGHCRPKRPLRKRALRCRP